MERVKLFHVKDFRNAAMNALLGEAPNEFNEDEFTFMGTFTVKDKSAVYLLTNNIDEEWVLSNRIEQMIAEGLALLPEGLKQARSTSAGDAYVVDGKAYILMGIGYKEVPIKK